MSVCTVDTEDTHPHTQRVEGSSIVLWIDHLKNYLIGISSDGDAKMVGQNDGFSGRIKRYLEEHRKKFPKRGIPISIPHWQCSSHRVELSLKSSFLAISMEYEAQETWSEAITAVIDKVADFYGSKATSRVDSLRMTVKDHELSGSLDHFLHLQHNFKIRWAPSALSARKTFIRMYKPIWDNMLEYENEVTSLSSSSRAAMRNLASRAKSFLLIFNNLTFYEHLNFEVGILQCVQFLSLESQRAEATLIDFPRVFVEFEKCITQFCLDPFQPYTPSVRESKTKKNSNPAQEVPFMRNVKVLDATGEVPIEKSKNGKKAIFGDRSPSLDQLRFRLDYTTDPSKKTVSTPSKDTFFDSLHTPHGQQQQEGEEVANARGRPLYRKVSDSQMILLGHAARVNYGNIMLRHFKKDFHNDMLEWAESFTIRKLIFDNSFGTVKGQKDVSNRKKFADLFRLNSVTIEDEIDSLRKSFIECVPEEMREKMESAKSDIVLFHTSMLGTPCYGGELQDAISRIITLPINSAGVERAYSILNLYMSKRRRSLNVPHLEAYVFLHVNGPEPHNFIPDSYVTEWLNEGHEATECLQSNEEEDVGDGEEDNEGDDFYGFTRAFSGKKGVPPLTIFN